MQGNYKDAAVQTGVGAVSGAVIESGIKKAAPVVSKVAAKVLPKPAIAMVGGAAKFVPILAAGYAGFEAINAIVEGVNGEGNGLLETGVAAEAKKDELRKNGYSNYDLRRRYRNGYTK